MRLHGPSPPQGKNRNRSLLFSLLPPHLQYSPPQVFGGAVDVQGVMAYEPDNWADALFQKRIPLTINAGKVPSTQLDFPLLIDNTFPDLIGIPEAELRIGSQNILFDYDIQSFDNSNGKLIARTKSPSVSDGDAVYVYFDSPGAVDAQNPNAVWSEFTYVAYLNNDPAGGANSILDSTATPRNGTPVDDVIQVNGKIGKALDFAGTQDFVSLGSIPLDDKLTMAGDDIAISIIIKPRLTGDGFQRIVDKSNGSSGADGFSLTLDDSEVVFYIDGNRAMISNNNAVPIADIFYHIVITKKSGVEEATVFVNGVDEFSQFIVATNVIPNTVVNNMMIGAAEFNVLRAFNGFIEDVTISTIIPTPDRIVTEFNNKMENAAFYSIGAVEAVPTVFDIMQYEDLDIMEYEA